jgi:dihydrofolate reductase
MDVQSQRGLWDAVSPRKLAKKDQHHPWVFAQYIEFPSEREDGNYYRVFLFRNQERSIFGMKEYRELGGDDFRDLATRVIHDREFRNKLISTDPQLPKFWKRH